MKKDDFKCLGWQTYKVCVFFLKKGYNPFIESHKPVGVLGSKYIDWNTMKALQ